MKTSRNNTRLIEKYLHGELTAAERLAFEAQLLVRPALRVDLYFQKKTYRLVRLYHRKKMKEELEMLHQQVFSDPEKMAFQQRIHQIFQ